jgi:hypothetical protein
MCVVPKPSKATSAAPAPDKSAAPAGKLTLGKPGHRLPKGFNLAALHKKLPCEPTKDATAARKKLWNKMDGNGSGTIAPSEAVRGIQNALGLKSIRPAIMECFDLAKDWKGGKGKRGGYVERNEFPVFMECLQDYFELWDMFDKSGTDQLTPAAKKLGEWGRPIPAGDEEKVFNEIEGKDKFGSVPFVEFAGWAITQKLKHGNLDCVDDDSDK